MHYVNFDCIRINFKLKKQQLLKALNSNKKIPIKTTDFTASLASASCLALWVKSTGKKVLEDFIYLNKIRYKKLNYYYY